MNQSQSQPRDLAGCCSQSFPDVVKRVNAELDARDYDSIEEVEQYAKTQARNVLRASQESFLGSAAEGAVFSELVGILCGRPLHEDVRVSQSAAEVFAEQNSCLQKLISEISADAMQALIAMGPKVTSRLTAFIQCQFGLSAQSSRQAAQACVTKAVMGLISGQSWKAVLLDLGTCLAMTAIPGMAGGSRGTGSGETGPGANSPVNPAASYEYSDAKRC